MIAQTYMDHSDTQALHTYMQENMSKYYVQIWTLCFFTTIY